MIVSQPKAIANFRIALAVKHPALNCAVVFSACGQQHCFAIFAARRLLRSALWDYDESHECDAKQSPTVASVDTFGTEIEGGSAPSARAR